MSLLLPNAKGLLLPLLLLVWLLLVRLLRLLRLVFHLLLRQGHGSILAAQANPSCPSASRSSTSPHRGGWMF